MYSACMKQHASWSSAIRFEKERLGLEFGALKFDWLVQNLNSCEYIGYLRFRSGILCKHTQTPT